VIIAYKFNVTVMKNRILLLMMLGLIILTSCKKEDKITAENPPNVDFISDDIGYQQDNVIAGAVGETMNVKAQLTDAVGIKSFRVSYSDWNLDNTINLTEFYPNQVLNNYTMDYNFLIPADADESKNHDLKLTVTNLGDLSSSKIITVMMDGDYEAPEISNVYPGNNSTVPGETLSISFDVSDNISIDYIVFEIENFNYYDSVYVFDDPKFFTYSKNINVDPDETYNYTIRTADQFKNQSVQAVKFNIGIPGIAHMFLVDQTTQEELDAGFIGASLRMVPTEAENEHSLVYYCAEAGTEIRFMDDMYSFNNAFNKYGVNGDTLVENGMDNPLILDQTGYYTFTINTDSLTFSQSGPVAPSELPDAITVPSPPWLYGRGVDDNHGGWDTYSENMIVDPNNEYIFHIESSLGDAEYDGYCEGCIGFELNGSTDWNDEYIWDDICWFGIQWFQDGVIDEIDENGGKPEGWAGLAGEFETWSDEEENYWNTWADLNTNYRITVDMYTRRVRIFEID